VGIAQRQVSAQENTPISTNFTLYFTIAAEHFQSDYTKQKQKFLFHLFISAKPFLRNV